MAYSSGDWFSPKAFETQAKLKDCETGNHKFGGWYSDPSGLARECINCHKFDHGKIFNGELIINPPLDKDGFLDEKKVIEWLKSSNAEKEASQ